MRKQDDKNALNFSPPPDLITAHSMIQQWYVAESSGQSFAKEFFTLEHVRQFSKVAIKSALFDSLIWLSIYVLGGAVVYILQENYLTEHMSQLLFWQVKGSPLFWCTKAASFMGLLFSSVLCIMMARYYAGTVCKKAINSIFVPRTIFLVCFSLVSFLLLGIAFKALSNENVIHIANLFALVNPELANKICYFTLYYLRRALFESAIVVLLASAFSVILPFLAISFFKFYKREKTDLGIRVE
jgi:hypothetical protein